METSISKDQLVHDLALIAAKGAVDAYIKCELDPSIGVSFGGTELAQEALMAYQAAHDLLFVSISED